MTDQSNKIGAASAASAMMATSTKKDEKSAGALNDQFMTLFLAQMQAQDPTEPMKNSEMLAQLAQISTVEQLETANANSQLEILASMSQSNMQAATLQGSNITFKTDSVYFDKNSTGLNGSLEDPGSLSGVQEVTISTASGETIKTIEVTKGEDGKYNWKWDGTDSNGNKAKEGEYIIAAKSVETKEPARVLAGGEVIEIGFEPMTHAVVEGGCRFKIGDMIKINKSESK